MRMISAGLIRVFFLGGVKVNCQLNLLKLFDDFSVGRWREKKQIVFYLAAAIVVGINLYVVKKQIGNRFKMVDDLKMYYQERTMSDPGMYRGDLRM